MFFFLQYFETVEKMSKWVYVNIVSETLVENLPDIFIAMGLGLVGLVGAWILLKIKARLN